MCIAACTATSISCKNSPRTGAHRRNRPVRQSDHPAGRLYAQAVHLCEYAHAMGTAPVACWNTGKTTFTRATVSWAVSSGNGPTTPSTNGLRMGARSSPTEATSATCPTMALRVRWSRIPEPRPVAWSHRIQKDHRTGQSRAVDLKKGQFQIINRTILHPRPFATQLEHHRRWNYRPKWQRQDTGSRGP